VGLAAAEEGRSSVMSVTPPQTMATPSVKGKLEAVIGGGEMGQGQLSVSLAWRAVKQVVCCRYMNVLLFALPFGALSGACFGGGR
jgi:hypothetical protein